MVKLTNKGRVIQSEVRTFLLPCFSSSPSRQRLTIISHQSEDDRSSFRPSFPFSRLQLAHNLIDLPCV
jgi:hypothetical protein